MKKFLVILLITVLALFALTGCEGITPAEGEGEGEGEEVVYDSACPEISISGSVEIDGKTYVKGIEFFEFNKDSILPDLYTDVTLTITYDEPTEGAEAYLGGIVYGAADFINTLPKEGKDIGLLDLEITLFPNEDYTVYTGSLNPYLSILNEAFYSLGDSIASLMCSPLVIKVISSCDDGDCICKLPFIYDFQPPFAEINVELVEDACACGGCSLKFSSLEMEEDCIDSLPCCGDFCSGLAGWSIALYTDDPFDDCCGTPCAEPVQTCSGDSCPIECITDCLTEDMYYVIVYLTDQVGNEQRYYAKIELNEQCGITLTEYEENISVGFDSCTDWNNTEDSDDTIGSCLFAT